MRQREPTVVMMRSVNWVGAGVGSAIGGVDGSAVGVTVGAVIGIGVGGGDGSGVGVTVGSAIGVTVELPPSPSSVPTVLPPPHPQHMSFELKSSSS